MQTATTPVEANVNLWFNDSLTLDDPGRYRRLIGKLTYLTVTWPDITFVVVLSGFIHVPRETHQLAAMRILSYIKSYTRKGLVHRKHGHVHISGYSDSGYSGDRGDRKSTTGYRTFAGGNLMTWRSKKQDVVSRSSVEAEYRVMAHTACEMVWLKNLLIELGFRQPGPMPIYCDNQSVIYIAQNSVFMKHIEVDCHFVRDTSTKKVIMFQFTPSAKQLAYLLTKVVSPQMYSNLCNKQSMLDVYAPA